MLFWRRYSGLLKFFIILICLVILIFLFCSKALYPVVFSLARVEAIRLANKAINTAVDKEIDNLDYEDLITYKCDDEGNIVLMQPNVREINQFSSSISLDIQKRLEEQVEQTVDIPLGKVLGMDIWAGFGPTFSVKVIVNGFTDPPAVIDSFESAGINQTRHKIYLQTEVKLCLIVPFSRQELVVASDVPLIEVTILGRVPKVYVGFEGKDLKGLIDNY